MQASLISDKFFTGTPYNHLSVKYALQGLSIPSSSAYEQVRQAAVKLEPLEVTIRRCAAQTRLLAYDDTRHRIIDFEPVLREVRNGKGTRLRTVIYCSCLIGHDPGREYVVFDIGPDHVGEVADDILSMRDPALPTVKTMYDALSAKKPAVGLTIESLCNVHGRRGLWEAKTNFPEQVNEVLNWYNMIWINDGITKKKKMSDDDQKPECYVGI